MTAHSPAKINAFLKITGKRENYHTLFSRFIKLPNLYDTISFVEKKESSDFDLEGNFNCKTQQNTIYKIYQALQKEAGIAPQYHQALQDNNCLPILWPREAYH